MPKISYTYFTLFENGTMEENESPEYEVSEEHIKIMNFISDVRHQNRNGNFVFSKPEILKYCNDNMDWAIKYCLDEYGKVTSNFEYDFEYDLFLEEVMSCLPESFFLYEERSDENPNGPDTGGGFSHFNIR